MHQELNTCDVQMSPLCSTVLFTEGDIHDPQNHKTQNLIYYAWSKYFKGGISGAKGTLLFIISNNDPFIPNLKYILLNLRHKYNVISVFYNF